MGALSGQLTPVVGSRGSGVLRVVQGLGLWVLPCRPLRFWVVGFGVVGFLPLPRLRR